jgi:gluconolactonase
MRKTNMKYRIASCVAAMAATIAAVAAEPGAAGSPTVTPAIAGVVAAGTAVVEVKDGFEGTEGPLPQADGSLLFTENRANRIVRVATDGSTSTWLTPSGAANALALTPKGEVVAALTDQPAIGVLSQGTAPQVLARDYEGKPFLRPNDLIASKLGHVYFTDPGAAPAAGAPLPPAAVYRVGADGKLTRIANDIPRPNGVALSPDERRLYVANTLGEWLLAFDLDAQGAVKGRSDFARLATPAAADGTKAGGADGIAVDEAGRVYVATTLGVQVFSPEGKALGIIALPKAPQNLAFSGKDRSVLYVVGRGSVYRIQTLTHGPHRAGK